MELDADNALFFEVRAGAFGYNGPTRPMAPAPAYEDLGTNIVSGKARSRELDISATRCSARSATSRTAGWARTTSSSAASGSARRARRQDFAGSYNDVLHILRNGAPFEVYLLEDPAKSENGLYTYGSYATGHLEAQQSPDPEPRHALDHYRNFLPEQEHPANQFTRCRDQFCGGQQPEHVEPGRAAGRRHLSTHGSGKTGHQGELRPVLVESRRAAQHRRQSRTRRLVEALRLDRRTATGVWESGEEGDLLATQGGVATRRSIRILKDQLHARGRRGSSASCSRTSASAPGSSGAARISSRRGRTPTSRFTRSTCR